MDIFKIKRTYLSAKRLQEIINVFIKHGFGQIIDQIHLGKYIKFKKRIRSFGRWPSLKGPTVAERLRKAFEELGPTFIKFGQLLSSRPDLVTSDYAKEFKKLQDNVPPFSIEQVYEIIEHELGCSVDKIFSRFNPVPLGSASIAQVHEATLLDGSEVIVKIQRPEIKDQINLDITILKTLAKLVEKYIPESKLFDPQGIVEEFSKSINNELDFKREAKNAMIFRENFKDDSRVLIPYVYREYLSEKILVMEKVEGVRIDYKESLKNKGIDLRVTLNNLIDIYFKQIFEHGFFHGDPHPGNILITDDFRIAFVDFGIIGKIDEEFKESFANIALAIINQDVEQLINEYLKLGIIPDEIDMDKLKKQLKKEIEEILYPIYTFKIEDIQISGFIESIMRVALKHKLKFLPELILIDKVLVMLEGLTRELCPDIVIIDFLKPYAKKVAGERLHPSYYINKTFKAFKEFRDAIENVPLQLKTLLKKAVKDEITLKMSLINLPEFLKDIDRASNKISFSLIVSAMILSSAIMNASQLKPLVYGVSLFGVVTGVVAFFLGIWLIISIIRSGKL